MRIPMQGFNALRGKAMVGALLVGIILPPSLPNAQEKSTSKPHSLPLLLVLVRPTTFSLHIVRAASDGRMKADLSQGDAIEAEPVLSPDGKNIAFTAVNADRSAADVCTMNVDGTGRIQITHSPKTWMAMSPAWSPDGSKLIYCALAKEQKLSEASLHVVDANGKNDKVIGPGTFPIWTKANKIAFTIDEETSNVAYIMDADGKNRKKFLSEALVGGWSPDGKHLLFTKGWNVHLAHVLVANADGTHPSRVTGTEYEHEYGAQWAADGKRLLFNRVVDNPIALGMMQVFTADVEGKSAKAITDKEDGLMLSNGSGLLLMTFMLAH
jgi:Tol biopolymer transport system component